MQSAQRVQAVRSGIALAIALGFLFVNGLVLGWVKSQGLEQRVLDIQTRPLYRLRLDGFFARAAPARAVFLGDSLIYGAHLEKSEGRNWEGRTLPAQAAHAFGARGGEPIAALNLGINGVLFDDLACVVDDVLARKPELLVIGLSPRPFSADFDRGGSESAREFLCSDPHPPPLSRLRAAVGDTLYRFVPAYRYRDLLQFRYLGTTPRAFLVGQALSRLSADRDEEDPDLAQALERMRAAQRLGSIRVDPKHLQYGGLERLLHAVRAQRTTQVLVFYLEEHLEVLGPAVDRAHYASVSRDFIELVTRALAGAPRARFVFVNEERLAGEYVDHIHLTARGYARLARILSAELPP